MSRRVLLIAVIVVIVIAGVAFAFLRSFSTSGEVAESAVCGSGDPVTFTAEEGFSATFPCVPNRGTRTATTPFGEITIITYVSEAEGMTYVASFVDYGNLIGGSVPEIAMPLIRDGAVRSVLRDAEVSDPVIEDITLGEYEGQSIRAAGEQERLWARLYYVNKITYQLTVVGDLDATELDAIAFLESFRLPS
jgi:hypothetical protein